jgi:hypothetical protein
MTPGKKVIRWLHVGSTVQYWKVQQTKMIPVATCDSNIQAYTMKIYHCNHSTNKCTIILYYIYIYIPCLHVSTLSGH